MTFLENQTIEDCDKIENKQQLKDVDSDSSSSQIANGNDQGNVQSGEEATTRNHVQEHHEEE